MTAALAHTDPTPMVTHFDKHAEWTGILDKDRDQWLARRNTLLTASDVGAILGEDPYKSALDVYVDKVTPRTGPEKIGLDDPRFWGQVLEQPILQAVAQHQGWEYQRGGALLVSRQHGHLGCTLDAEIDRGSGWQPFEGKTSRLPRGWDEESGELPTRVLIQVQTQLLVTGAEQAVVFALLQGSRPVQIEVEASAEFHAVILEESERFMARVKTLDPPSPDGSKASERALKRLYPTDDGGVVALPPEAADWTREIQELAEQEKELKRRSDELRNLLRASIGTAKYGLLPEKVGGSVTWRWQRQLRKSYTVKESESRVLCALKHPPEHYGATSPPAPPELHNELVGQLEASVEQLEPTKPIRRKRRQARR